MIVSKKFFLLYLSVKQSISISISRHKRGVLRRKYCKQCVYNVGASEEWRQEWDDAGRH